jgi:hypothetical protein
MDLRQLRFGIEVETIRRMREDVARAIQRVVGGTASFRGGIYDAWEVADSRGKLWKVVSDSSLLSVSPRYRAEIVSPVLAYDDLALLQNVVREVRRAGACVDANYAIHIHVDAAAFDGRTLAKLTKLIFKQESLILTALGIREQRLRQYTKPISPQLIEQVERRRPRTRDELNAIWYGYHNQAPQHYDDTRYHGVNLHNVWYRGTIEFRWFEGTLHAGKIKAYVQLVLAVAAKALTSRSAASQRRSLDTQSARYDFRVFLLRLGLIGDEFKTARKHLLESLPGDSAFKRGRPPRLPKPDEEK